MPQSLYALAFLACPLGMGLMMWMMMRGKKEAMSAENVAGRPADRSVELLREERRRLDVKIDELETADHAPRP
jgi:hypothetical protein